MVKKATNNRYYSIVDKGKVGSNKGKQKQLTDRELSKMKQKYAKIRDERKRRKKEGYNLAKFELEYI